MRFNVYGRYHLLVERSGRAWRVLQIGEDGKRGLRDDISIPADLTHADEVAEFLDVLLHEHARPGTAIRLVEE